MNLLFIDFESYYSSADFTLKKMSVLEYIRDPRFKVHGLGLTTQPGRAVWYTGAVVAAELAMVDWSKTTVVAHNVKFDGAILAWHYGIKPAGYICTQSMARALLGYKVRSHSLAAVAKHFGLVPKGHMATDGLRDLTPAQECELADYCLHDVELCASIFSIFSKSFPAGQYQALDWTIRAFVEPVLQLDGDVLKEVNTAEKVRRATIIEDVGIPKAQLSSNQKFAALLAERGYEVPMKKSPTAAKRGLVKMIPALAVQDQGFLDLRNSGNPELETICEARIAAKSTLLETRSEKFMGLVKFGTFPFDVQFSGAHTHRFSGASGAGGNPQNLPRGSGLRKAVIAPAESSLLVADFAAIEARVVAWLAREQKLIDDFTLGRDPYCQFATRIYSREITKADKRERQFGKTCILGLGYGMGAAKFAYKVRLDTQMVIDKEESRRVVNLYRMFYSRIPGLWGMLDHYIPLLADRGYTKLPGLPFLTIRDGCVILPSGLTLQYPNLRWDPTDRTQTHDGQWVFDAYSKGQLERRALYGGKLLENISQALAGEITKLAIERAEAAGLRCAGQVHDEVIAVVPVGREKEAAAVLQKAMEDPPQWWSGIKLKAEVGSGPNWLEAKV